MKRLVGRKLRVKIIFNKKKKENQTEKMNEKIKGKQYLIAKWCN